MSWYFEVLKKYAVFSGRARRKEYWMFALFNFHHQPRAYAYRSVAGIAGVLSGIYSLAVLIPYLALTVRRLHDTGRSGWWLLVVLIPLIGVIVLLVFMVLDSQPEENRYGPNPKAVPA